MKNLLKVLVILAVAIPCSIFYQNAGAEKQISASLHIDHSKYSLSSTLPDNIVGTTTAIILEGGNSHFVNVDLAVYGGKTSNDPMAIIMFARAPFDYVWSNKISNPKSFDVTNEIIGDLDFQAETIIVNSKDDAFAELEPNAPAQWITRRYISDHAGNDNTIVLEYREPLPAQAKGMSANPTVPTDFNERANKAFINMPSSEDTISMKGRFIPNSVKEKYIQYALPELYTNTSE